MLRQLLALRGAVFAFEFMRPKLALVVDDILCQSVIVAVPIPGLEGYALSFFRFMNIGRRIGRLVPKKRIVVTDTADEDAAVPFFI